MKRWISPKNIQFSVFFSQRREFSCRPYNNAENGSVSIEQCLLFHSIDVRRRQWHRLILLMKCVADAVFIFSVTEKKLFSACFHFGCKMFVYSKRFVKSVFHWVLLFTKWVWSMLRVVGIIGGCVFVLSIDQQKKKKAIGKKLLEMFYRQLILFFFSFFLCSILFSWKTDGILVK